MNIEGKSAAEIQQHIYNEMAAGKNPQVIKEELSKQGVPVEGYYFTTEAQRAIEMVQPPSASSGPSAGQVIWGVVLVIIVILKVIRCNSQM